MSDQDSKYAESLVTQETLDSLLKEAEETPVTDLEDSKDLDLVSPEDIEKLLGGSSAIEAESDLDLISQDDIDSLISGEELGSTGSDTVSDSDDSLISQDDIDALLNGGGTVEESEPEASDTSESDLISQDDIDALLSGTAPDDTASEEAPGEPADDTLISQDDIDALLSGAGSDETGPEPEKSDPQAEEDALISQDDIDSLLQESTDEPASIEDDEPEQLITQDDIDKLLSDEPAAVNISEAEEADEAESLVSQDEINKLLNADIEEIEAIPDDVSDQVILEKGEPENDDSGKKGIRDLLKSKVFIGAVAAVFLFVVIGVGVKVFMSPPEIIIADKGDVDETLQEELPETMSPDEDFAADLADSALVEVDMKDFVVPAPLAMKGISYISLDISMEIVDVTSNPIKGYEPFFRNIIYEVLKNALTLQNESGIIEADLINMIKAALDDALSEGSIGKIDFLDFKVT